MSRRRQQGDRRCPGGLLPLLLLAAAVPTLAAETQRPEYSFLRQEEDWSVLADSTDDPPADRWDRLKYVRLSADGRRWASFGGSLRGRIEGWDDFGFGVPAPEDDDVFGLSRVLMHGDFRFGARARVFVELKSALASNRDLPGGKRPLDVDSFDLQQAFVDVAVHPQGRSSVVLRVGRQALQFGRQRLISPLPWGNSLRSWDGFSVVGRAGRWRIDAFATRFAPVRPHDLNEADEDWPFHGVYASRRTGPSVVEAYLLYLGREGVEFNGTGGSEKRWTVGSRWQLERGRAGVEAEMAYQTGQVGTGDVRAWMAAAELTYTTGSGPRAARLHAGVDYASGDDAPGGDVGTFNQLFPLAHAYLGMLDAAGRQNVASGSFGVRSVPRSGFELQATVQLLRRAERGDAYYTASGEPLLPGGPGTSRELGTEIDLLLRHRVSAHLSTEAGFGRLLAGAFIDASTPGQNIDFAYLQCEYRF